VLRKLLAAGQIDPDLPTVIINSGEGLKTPDAAAAAFPVPAAIPGTLAAFEELESSLRPALRKVGTA